MNFDLPPELAALRQQVRTFVDERVIPLEWAIIAEDKAGERTTLKALQADARAAGLWTPHLPAQLGGRGLGVMGMCALFREMGRSPVGAAVFHCDAPDQGNMDLLAREASPALQERWLQPLVRGEISSAFCMTEPAPGAGADPANLRTRAFKDGIDWVIDGHKWYATGGGAASVLLVMARTDDGETKSGAGPATLFAVPRDAVGVEHVRDIPTMAEPILVHREAELRFHNVRVREEAVIGQVGQGFVLAQKRLVPARLTHCMRWLGLADRALEMCKKQLETRTSFGKILSQHQMVQKKLADAVHGLHAGNLMTLHCAWMLEEGRTREARGYSSMCKNHVAKLLCDVLDDCIQIHGGLGFSDDMPFAQWYRHARAARIADGPEEVHDVVVARDWLAGKLTTLV